MALKVSKTALVVLVVSLAVIFLATHIMYARANENTLTMIVQQQSLDTNRLMNIIVEKQKELDAVKIELESAKMKISALTASVPAAAQK